MADALASGIKTIQLAPGTYQTQGYIDSSIGSKWTLGPGTRLIGSGVANTTLIRDRTVFNETGGDAEASMIRAFGDHVTVADLTIDCNSLPADARNVHAVQFNGNYCTARNLTALRAIGQYVSEGDSHESLVFAALGDEDTIGNVFEFCVVRDVVTPTREGSSLFLSAFYAQGSATFRECSAFLPVDAGVGFNTESAERHLLDRSFVEGGLLPVFGETGQYQNLIILPSDLPNSPPSIAISSPAPGALFITPNPITISTNASDADGIVTSVAFYAGSTLLHTDTTSPFSFSWINPPIGDHDLQAVATDNQGASNTSTLVPVSVQNTPPAVSISSPSAGATFPEPATIAIQANASDGNGTIASVAFFQGSTLLGTDTSAPYEFDWTGMALGDYSLSAVATDNLGASTTSPAIQVSVVNSLPTVSITSPSSGTEFAAPASIVINSTASDANGSVVRVDFYSGVTLIGSDLSSPFSFTWNGVTAGTYSISATATDNLGATSSSIPVNINVVTSGGYSPIGDSRVIFWLDSSDSTGLFQNEAGTQPVTTNGQFVGRWNDKSQNSWHVSITGGGDSNRPIFSTNQQNGKPSIRFDGSGDFLRSTSARLNGNNYTVFVVARRVSEKWLEAILSIHDFENHDWNNPHSLVVGQTADSGDVYDVRDDIVFSTRPHPGSGVTFTYGTRFDGSTIMSFINGVPGIPGPSTGNLSAERIVLGGRGEPRWPGNNYEYFEVLIFDEALDDSERQSVEAYLNQKYVIY
ncbi:MAG: Ig-like domain-containing protein [Opitutaceae bacterium]